MNAQLAIAQGVLAALAHAKELDGVQLGPIDLGAHLFSDLGFTSLQITDLALCLELKLGFEEFPLQDWLDAQPELGVDGFTVRSLIAQCEALRPTPG